MLPPLGCPGAAPRIRLFLPARHLRWGSRRGPYVPGRRRGEGLRLVAAAAAPAPPRRQGPGAGAAATGLCALLLRGDRRCRREGQGCERPGRLGPPSLFYFFIFFFSGGKKKKKTQPPKRADQPKKTLRAWGVGGGDPVSPPPPSTGSIVREGGNCHPPAAAAHLGGHIWACNIGCRRLPAPSSCRPRGSLRGAERLPLVRRRVHLRDRT